MKKIFKNDNAFWRKKRNRIYRWLSCRMDIDEQKNRNCSYLMGDYHKSVKSKWRIKEKKYECKSKMVLYTISKESSDLSCRYSCWSRTSKKISRKMFKFINLNEVYRVQSYLELSQIANMDETPIFFNMARTKKIVKIGSKQ